MTKLPAWFVPVVSFSIAAALSTVAGGHLGILPRFAADPTANCAGALTKACVTFTNYSENINNLTTVTTAPDAGTTVLTGKVTYTATYNIHYKGKKADMGVTDTLTLTSNNTGGPTVAGPNVTTNNYPVINVPEADFNALILSNAVTKYGTAANPVTAISGVQYQPVWSTSVAGSWSTPKCGSTNLGPRVVPATLKKGTGNACN